MLQWNELDLRINTVMMRCLDASVEVPAGRWWETSTWTFSAKQSKTRDNQFIPIAACCTKRQLQNLNKNTRQMRFNRRKAC